MDDAPATIDVLTPFIVAIGIQVMAWLASLAIPNRVAQLLERLAAPSPVQFGPGITSGHVADIVGWGIDLSASLGTVVGPITALILLHQGTGNALLTSLYIVTFVVSLALFIFILNRDDAGAYLRAVKGVPLSPGLIIGIGVNGIALLVAWLGT